ncbi:MAG: hypothetical protein AAF415_02345 [Pseudomonadota bacterium]
MGFRKRKGCTVEEHRQALEKLAIRLAYMSEAGLRALKSQVEMRAEGQARNVWPDPISILHWAWAIEQPPARDSDFVRRIMGSRIGARALEHGGFAAAALLRHLKRTGTVPTEQNRGWDVIFSYAAELREIVEKTERICREDDARLPQRDIAFAREVRAGIDRATRLIKGANDG